MKQQEVLVVANSRLVVVVVVVLFFINNTWKCGLLRPQHLFHFVSSCPETLVLLMYFFCLVQCG